MTGKEQICPSRIWLRIRHHRVADNDINRNHDVLIIHIIIIDLSIHRSACKDGYSWRRTEEDWN